MKQYTAAEIAALKGTEFTYEYGKANGPHTKGMSGYAYVAQADINKGITIMGVLPKGTAKHFGTEEGKEIIIQCCSLEPQFSKEKSDQLLHEYVTRIRSGVFNPDFDSSHTGGGSAGYVSSRCQF